MPEPIKTALSLAAALLFLWSAVWCIRRVFSPEPAPHYTEPSSRSRCWAAIAGAAFILVLHLIFAVTAHINYPEADFHQAIEWQFYGNTDSRHYLDLSIYGYGTQEAFPEQYLQIVFFPLYPALLHILHFVTRIDAFWLGFAVQLPLFAAATASFYTVIARRWDEQTAALSLALLLASPASVFFAVPMTESLFLLLTVRYVLTLEREQWWRCASLGVLAGLCRAPGGLLFGADRPVSLYAVAARYAAHDTVLACYVVPGCRTWPLFSAELPRIWAVEPVPDIPMGQLEPEAGAVHQYCALPPGLHGAVVGQQPQKRPCAMPGCGALPVDNFGTAVCHGAPPSGALARLRSCLFCRNDGYHLADQRPAVRSGAVLPARCLGAAFAGPPTAHKGCTGNAGYRKRYLHNAISIRLADLLKKTACLPNAETGSFLIQPFLTFSAMRPAA